MKRLRDDQTKRDPSRKRSTPQSSHRRGMNSHPNPHINSGIRNGISTLASQALASAPMVSGDVSDMQIDPSLLQAANDPSFGLGSSHRTAQSFGYVDPM